MTSARGINLMKKQLQSFLRSKEQKKVTVFY